MTEVKKEATAIDKPAEIMAKVPTMRQIVIETDGSAIRVVKNQTAGSVEFVGILQALLSQFNQSIKK